MSDKVQLIKEEIERLKEENSIGLCEYDAGYCNGVGETCEHLLSFIKSQPEEPVSEDLEEEIDRFEDWLNNFNQSDYPTSYTVRDIARHFAEWGRKHK